MLLLLLFAFAFALPFVPCLSCAYPPHTPRPPTPTQNERAGAVNYAAFVDEVDQAFTQPGLESAPTRTLDSHARDVAKGPRRPLGKLNVSEQAHFDSALAAIKSRVRTRGLNLVPMFQDFDRKHEELVSEAQFCRVLKMADCLPTSQAATAALLKR